MIKIKFIYNLALLVMLFSCIKETKKSYLIEKELDPVVSGAWMMHDYTFENDDDFRIGFVKGAGVSSHHDLIFYGYKNQKLIENENFYWKVNSIEYSPEEIEKNNKTKYHYSKGGENYYGKKVKIEFFEKNKVIFTRDKIYIPKPLEVKFRLNGESVQSNNVSEPILKPQKDILELEWNIESHNSKLMLMLIKSPAKNKVGEPCYNIEKVDQRWLRREIRYFFVEDTGKLTLDKCFFEGIIGDMVHEDDLVFLSLSRGNLHKFTNNDKKFIIYDLSRGSIGFKIE
ncbi:hypothetical protein [Flexithrix dorotheae]|uniref:hypothetical protein n=1 Tax=Flexithrix dorotheae TaxID=70993 RepID=UPI0012F87BED|nr:hypothetical protein [Flexithrix dorotheae]